MHPSDLVQNVVAEVTRSFRHPERLRKLLSPEKRRMLRARILTSKNERTLASPWVQTGNGISRRAYSSYEEYVAHQASKLRTLDLRDYDARFYAALSRRIAGLNGGAGRSALCLGARLGTEVRVFKDAGFFAVGVDLNPGDGNQHVLCGDFHRLAFPDNSVDVVFSNSLDHSLDVNRVLAEAMRVVVPGGYLVLELMKGADAGSSRGFFESTFWNSAEDVLQLPALVECVRVADEEFDVPWKGRHVRLRAPEGP